MSEQMRYPPSVHPLVAAEDAERFRREFRERQKRRAAEIREWKRKHAAAMKAGDAKALRELGPMYP